jgi:predicted glycosyltransferase
VRIWVDLTNSPHVLAMRPLIAAMRADGHEVEVTARAFAQTLELCERFGIPHTARAAAWGRSPCPDALWTLKASWLTLIWSFRPAVR